MNPNRIFILGAGFSSPAGLPLGRDLFPMVRARAREEQGSDNTIERDLREFLNYKHRCGEVNLGIDDIDLEEFVGFLDVEHSLRLSGGDTLTEDGNRSQLAIRSLIGAIIQSRTPRDTSLLPAVYKVFAEKLSPGDTVITFNYDILLERILEQEKKPFRLFPNRFSKVHPTFCEVDGSRDEVIILKLHGSVDWFYRKEFDLGRDVLRATGHQSDPHSALFGSRARHKVIPIVQGPRPPDEELARIFRVVDPDAFYGTTTTWEAPYLLTPSSAKALYAAPLRELWNGLGQIGGLNLGLSVIGFSLPAHDEYLRQVIYRIAVNYQYFEPNLVLGGRTKTKAAVIDYRTSPESIEELKRRYSFFDWSRTELYCNGLDETALQLAFK